MHMSCVLKLCIAACATGQTLMLPVMVEQHEILILLHRKTDTAFKMVIVQTDPTAGLQYHDSEASPPSIKFRTCLVLDNIPKKFALDDVFWMAVYKLTISAQPGDTDKFYGILLPFLTGKPLEMSLIESREASPLREPQRSATAYVQCIYEAVNYILSEQEVPQVQIDQVLTNACCAVQLSNSNAVLGAVGRMCAVCSHAAKRLAIHSSRHQRTANL